MSRSYEKRIQDHIELNTMPLRFRAWDKDYKQFVQPQDPMLNWLNAWVLEGKADNSRKADRYTISQDTGLADKNGKPIFTGDIVKCWDDEPGEVYYDHTLLQLRVKFKDGDDEDLASCEPEVISNIWEGANNE